MRTVLKVALPLLMWPFSVRAQDHVLPDQPVPPAQTTELQGFVPASELPTPPSTEPMRIPVLVQPTPAFIYVHPQPKPTSTVAAGYAPALNISAGFAVTSLGLPSSGRAILSGVDASIATDSGKRFGAKLDLSYQRAPSVYNSGHPMDVFSYLIGPVFYPSSGSFLSTQFHVLVGGARVAGPFPNGTGTLNLGRVNYPAWAVGGGVEYRLSPGLGFRAGVDYLQTHFYGFSGAVRRQNDIRIVNSLVYYLGKPVRNR